MKKITLFLGTVLIGMSAFSQPVEDSTSMEALYAKQVFYSLDNGLVSSTDNNNWDLAFAIYGQGAAGSAILLNEATTTLWAYPGDTSAWSTFDTTGYVAWEQLLNSDTTWTNGAFNKYRGASGTFDMGWGVLNPLNNYWTFGDSLYLAKLGDGSFKKIWILSLKTGVWEFKYANLDGSSEKTITITKADYTNRNFVYHSLSTDSTIDREPDNTAWDFTFTKHTDEAVPGVFVSVTSVFNNRNVWTAKSNEATLNDALAATAPQTAYNQNISNIGREWKKYSSGSGWTVYDTIAYFIYDNDSTDFYRLVFTGFGGMGTGTTYFTKELLETLTWIEENFEAKFSMYPNPATDRVTLLMDYPKNDKINLSFFDLNGRMVHTVNLNMKSGVNQNQLDLSFLPKGMYMVHLRNEEFSTSQKLILK